MATQGVPNVWQLVSVRPTQGSMDSPAPNQTFGYLNKTYGPTGNQPFPYNGDPAAAPFPWFPWNNRPFASQMELLLVPRGNPASMLLQHSVRQPMGVNPYLANANQQAEFTHLLGFFDSANVGGDTTVPAHLYRLLEFVHAPSRYSGTESLCDGATFGQPGNTTAETLHLRPPFNALSRYREPGKVNLNTVFDIDTWRALLGAPRQGISPGTDQWVQQSWSELVASRRGYPGPADPALVNPPGYPSCTSSPFGSYAQGHLNSAFPAAIKPGVEATLLRSTALPNPNKQFQSDGNPLFSPRNVDAPYRDARRNPYFRYQGLERLGSLATTRSNVFAVWLTVGYFEVTTEGVPNNPDAYPDGYWLGAELGSDTGQVTRHRAFYIIDRTIPAAFEPGEDHNVEQTILLRRLIE
jgi:hypothetical protein